jgi:hypothetical protein
MGAETRLVVVAHPRGLEAEFEAFLQEMGARYPGSPVVVVGDAGHVLPGLDERQAPSVVERVCGAHTRTMSASVAAAVAARRSSPLVDSLLDAAYAPDGRSAEAVRRAALVHYRTLFRRWADALPPGGLVLVNGGAADVADALQAALWLPVEGTSGGKVALLHGCLHALSGRTQLAGIAPLLPGPCGIFTELSNVMHPEEYARRLRQLRQLDVLCVSAPPDTWGDLRDVLCGVARMIVCPATPVVSARASSSSDGDSQTQTLAQSVLLRVRSFLPQRNFVLLDADPARLSAQTLSIEFLCGSVGTCSVQEAAPAMKAMGGEVRVHAPSAISVLANFRPGSAAPTGPSSNTSSSSSPSLSPSPGSSTGGLSSLRRPTSVRQ